MSSTSLLKETAFAVALAATATIGPAATADYFETSKLTAPDGEADDRFGFSVAIDGDLAVIGAPFDADRGPSAGAAYVFRHDGTSWVEEQRLVADDTTAEDRFGWSVSIDGLKVLIGAPMHDGEFHDDAGAAYVFGYDGSEWVEQQRLEASDGDVDDAFGESVSLYRSYLIIGASKNNDDGPASGSAYVFRSERATWVEEQKLLPPDAEAHDRFGRAVAITADVVVVGAYGNDDAGEDSGSAYVFRRNDSSWSDVRKLVASDGAEDDQFGVSVSIDENLLIVGAELDDDRGVNSGSAYVYRWSGAAWIEEQKLTASDGASDDVFGRAVSIDGDVALVTAPCNDDEGFASGSAYFYRHDGARWVQESTLVASDAAEDDEFGFSASISGERAIVGAMGNDDDGLHSGAAYVQDRAVMVGRARGDQSGRAIANAGDMNGDGYDEIVVGAPFNDAGGRKAGRVTVYDGRTFLPRFSKRGRKKDELGRAVAGAGDVNRDGVPDVVVGAPGHDRKTGRVDVYSGRDGRRLHRVTGAARGDRFGWSVAGGLDVNDDRRADFVVGAPKNDDAGGSAGKVYVFSGRNGSGLGTLRGKARGDRFGWSVALLRANGDPFADILIGAPKNDARGKNAGRAYVYSGKNLRRLFSVKGERAGDQHGYALTALRNANRRDDFAVGSPFHDSGDMISAGQVTAYAGRSGAVRVRVRGSAENDRHGESLGCAGDVDADGRVDLIVGVPRYGATGRVTVYSGANWSRLVVIDGAQPGQGFGRAVAGGYHDAGDQRSDLLIGAPGSDLRASNAGRVHVWRSVEGPLARPEPEEDGTVLAAAAPSSLGTYFPEASWPDELVHLLTQWGADADDADENGDGVVDVQDLRELLEDR